MTNSCIKTLQQLRVIGITEGVSYVFLLIIAMPLKYIYDYPLAVKYTGWIHGLLFILYIVAVLRAGLLSKWNLWRVGKYLIASLVPLATFFLDRELKKEVQGNLSV